MQVSCGCSGQSPEGGKQCRNLNSTFEDERVFCRLPKHWGGQKVRLLRALYGLRISPRRWFDTYRKFLEGRGWVMCESQPGLFRKGDMLTSIYVDDSFISGPNLSEIHFPCLILFGPVSVAHPVVTPATATPPRGSRESANSVRFLNMCSRNLEFC